MTIRPRGHRRAWWLGGAFAAALAAATVPVLWACQPVSPSVEPTRWRFEGFDVVSYVPEDPVAVAYLFHGTGGGAGFADRVETVDVLNELTGRGYGYVVTESTERTGDRRWDAADASLETNPDLARLVRLHDELVGTTPLDRDTPVVGVGMSNGARFVTLWGQAWADAGVPVAAIAPYLGRIAAPVERSGGLTVPAFFVAAENDTTSPPGPIAEDHAATAAAGTPAELHVARESALAATRFTRIPGVDAQEADAVFDAFVAAGLWDAGGRRQVPVADAVTAAPDVPLPPSVADQRRDVLDQVAVVLAVHQMRADLRVEMADFFDAHLADAR